MASALEAGELVGDVFSMIDAYIENRSTTRASDYYQNARYAAVAFSVAAGAVIVSWLVYWLITRFCIKRPKRRHLRQSIRKSSVHLLALVIRATILIGGLFWAFHSAGFNVLNLTVSLGVVGILMGVVVNSALPSVLTFWALVTNNALQEDDQIEFVTMPLKGQVTYVGVTWVVLQTEQDGVHKDVFVPTQTFSQQTWLKVPEMPKEKGVTERQVASLKAANEARFLPSMKKREYHL